MEQLVKPCAAWRVYLLACADGTLYCGSTTDLERRVKQHNGVLSGGARYTRGRRPVGLVDSALCSDRSEALRLENAIKRVPRDEKLTVLRQAKRDAAV